MRKANTYEKISKNELRMLTIFSDECSIPK